LETGNVHVAEDLVQETYLSAFRSLYQLSDPAGFRPWLLAIAHRKSIDSAKNDARLKRSPPTQSDMPLSSVSCAGPLPEQEAFQAERRQCVLAVLRSLPEDYRLPLMLRYIGETDAESIGIQLGLTNGALRGLLHRGLKMLRERLPADFAGDVDD
jgi:RNA polymerase sigma-70 factor (ECF subfamily)